MKGLSQMSSNVWLHLQEAQTIKLAHTIILHVAVQRYDALKRADACKSIASASLKAHLKKKIGTLRHVVVARVRNRPTLVLCLAVLGFSAPSSLDTLSPCTEVQPHMIYPNPIIP